MENMQIPFLFSFHVILLGVKIWFIWVMIDMFKVAKSDDKNLSMIMFKKGSIILLFFISFIVVIELWFIYSFYSNVNLFPYDYASIFDQIVLSILLAISYKGERK